ncbi:hypothetical protein N7478_002291 [Penicillium angulare]|uniref:uncharacterized protein n=1 Tax=Penicillium angulare TaxID=116970 RepID=UPI002541B1CB|nr:uncharacterized protein N7478_002291 [Penicillium angulare]KAJ5286605.1 hypothetical protein N7478_002291 [Penicillium angulare]
MSTPTKRKVHRRKRRHAPRRDRVQKSQSGSSAKGSKSSTKSGILPPSDDPLEENIFEREPMPQGYVFVPKGSVYITRHCRSNTKESKKVVFVIYQCPPPCIDKEQDKAAKRTLGIRVPREIHENVSEQEALTSQRRSDAVDARDSKTISRARDLLLEEFPLMPRDSLKVILDHAFLKGSGRVGRTSMTTDKRKASLAVEAHIRHMHTPYESLLDDGVDRSDAREKVWPIVKAIKKTWEGSTDGNFVDLTLR